MSPSIVAGEVIAVSVGTFRLVTAGGEASERPRPVETVAACPNASATGVPAQPRVAQKPLANCSYEHQSSR